MMHMYAQYGHIITNYALILAITYIKSLFGFNQGEFTEGLTRNYTA